MTEYNVVSWVGKFPWRRKWQPNPVFLPGKFMHRGVWWATFHEVTKESDMTQQLNKQTNKQIPGTEKEGKS